MCSEDTHNTIVQKWSGRQTGSCWWATNTGKRRYIGCHRVLLVSITPKGYEGVCACVLNTWRTRYKTRWLCVKRRWSQICVNSTYLLGTKNRDIHTRQYEDYIALLLGVKKHLFWFFWREYIAVSINVCLLKGQMCDISKGTDVWSESCALHLTIIF